MTLQAYIDNIRAKTGMSPKDFVRRARAKGLLRPDVTVKEVVGWLKDEFGLGYGHALAIYALLKPKMGKKGHGATVPNK
jgi:Domain of unknown function (DUF4287)